MSFFSRAGKRPAPCPPGITRSGTPRRSFSGSPHPLPPQTRPVPASRVPRDGVGDPVITWRVVTEQEAFELHCLAGGLRSHGNGQTAAGRRGACAGALAGAGRATPSPGSGGGACGRAQKRVPGQARRGRGAPPAPAVARICLGVPGDRRELQVWAPGPHCGPRWRHRTPHPSASGVASDEVPSPRKSVRAT